MRIGDQHPVHAELGIQALEVGKAKVFPSLLGFELAIPDRTEFGNLGDDRRILDGIGELAALIGSKLPAERAGSPSEES